MSMFVTWRTVEFVPWRAMVPFWSALTAAVIAQLLKPLINYIFTHKWNWSLARAAGGFPSSHSALVSALSLSVGLHEQFRSSIFAVTLAFSVIVIYDAANVRYYSGQNIKVTQQLVKDLEEMFPERFNDPLYDTKLKPVLGHRWFEVFGGIVLGLIVAGIFHILI